MVLLLYAVCMGLIKSGGHFDETIPLGIQKRVQLFHIFG